ncbi:nucleotide exchange factor GrpE [Patescibacteria group bacterium]|nr:nucleotide exchange factor GrpE [Patescibacteria group bacterium]MBU1682721.1 nucleotide exchange factor GrpE [Patescibacteria group bacterium]MBU1934881.1 nucleotide exchange factor GrpE [Patescibacteria group bacterium]
MTDENNVTNEDLNKMVREAENEDDVRTRDIASKEEEAEVQPTENEAKIEELTNALARAMADLQNFKRRTEEDQGRFVKFANAELLNILLPIINNFDRSAEHLPDNLKDNDWAKGVIQIHDELLKTLEKIGVKKIKTVGEKLDPNFHEGLMAGPGEKDIITEEFEPGYTYNDQVLKAAKVKVGDGTKK